MFKLFFLLTEIILAPFHNWHLIDHKYYQPISNNPILPQPDLSNSICPLGMFHIQGFMKMDKDPNPYGMGTVEYLQKTTCTKWINKYFPERCAEFDRNQWLKISNNLPTQSLDFCMDRFEYPNQEGQYPMIYITWNEANELCQADNKRMCSEQEWTFACEGEEATPYPTGYSRPDGICNIDKKWREYNPHALMPRENAGPELDRLWQGDVSGADPLCKSVFGVQDMVGNIDEWTSRSFNNWGNFDSILKGGYWGPVRTRCRPSTRNHGPVHIFYQEGTRCCSNLK